MTTLHYQTAEYVLCDEDTPGARAFVYGGQQDDGTFLYMFDLDSHDEHQNAAALLNYGRQRAPEVLNECTIVPTKRGGFHIPFRYHRALNPGNIYDPRTGLHAGELLQDRIDPVDAPLLTTMELCDLIRALHVPGIFPPDDDQAPAELRGASTTPRKEYRDIGESLIVGWERVRNPRQRLDALCADRPRVAMERAKLRTRADRSAGYGAFVQCLMFHAHLLGTTTDERCMMVAALAIAAGAGGKEDERDYKIEQDTAVLIAKILDGAPMQPRADGTIPHWQVPKWYRGEILPAPTPTPTPERKPAHRPPGDRARMVKRLEKLIRRWLDDSPSGRLYYYVADIADDMRCSPRAVQNYLEDLEKAKKIKRGQVGGRGGRAYMDIQPAFWCARKSEKPDTADVQSVDFWDAHASAEYRAPMPGTADQNVQCIEEGEAPKACAPAQPRQPQPVDDQAVAAQIAAHFAREVAKPRPRTNEQTPLGSPVIISTPKKVQASNAKARRRTRWAGMASSLEGAQLLDARRWRVERKSQRAANAGQQGRLHEIAREMEHYAALGGVVRQHLTLEAVDLPDFGAAPRAAGAHTFGAPLPASGQSLAPVIAAHDRPQDHEEPPQDAPPISEPQPPVLLPADAAGLIARLKERTAPPLFAGGAD